MLLYFPSNAVCVAFLILFACLVYKYVYAQSPAPVSSVSVSHSHNHCSYGAAVFGLTGSAVFGDTGAIRPHVRENMRRAVAEDRKTEEQEDYTYVIQEYCRPRDRTRSTDREIRALTKALRAYGPRYNEYIDRLSVDAVPYIDIVFSKMIDPVRRASTPDPLRRYDNVVDEVIHDPRVCNEDESYSVDPEDMPRHMLLRMVRSHLMANNKMYGA